MGSVQARTIPLPCNASSSTTLALDRNSSFYPQHGVTSFDHHSPEQEPLTGRVEGQMGQTAPAHQALSGPQLERGEAANLVRCGQLRADCKCLKGVAIEGLFLNILQILSL